MSELKLVEEARKPLAMNPRKFALWLLMVSIGMLFAAWTSAYIVRRGEGEWLYFKLPPLLWVNTVLIMISSATMLWAVRMARRDELERLKLALMITTLLGVAFLVGQWIAWGQLVAQKVYFAGGNVSGSFVYVLTAVHGLHLVSGVIFLIVVLISGMRFKVHSRNMERLELCATYWHFLDGLWVYLFIFLLLNR
jgi:cytochrome c oxidase subunit III